MKPWMWMLSSVMLALGATWLSILAVVGVLGDGFGAIVTGGRVETGFTDSQAGMRQLRNNADLLVFGVFGASLVCFVMAIVGWVRR